jgi:hypothetical protein
MLVKEWYSCESLGILGDASSLENQQSNSKAENRQHTTFEQ